MIFKREGSKFFFLCNFVYFISLNEDMKLLIFDVIKKLKNFLCYKQIHFRKLLFHFLLITNLFMKNGFSSL